MKRKLLLSAGICALALAGLLCFSAHRSTPEAFYTQHEAALHTAVEEILASGSVQGISVEGVEQMELWSGPILAFHTSGFGLAPSSHYRGLYYSPDDTPVPFQNASVPLEPSETGWTWTDGTDNHGTTCRIAPCWYTFEAHF